MIMIKYGKILMSLLVLLMTSSGFSQEDEADMEQLLVQSQNVWSQMDDDDLFEFMWKKSVISAIETMEETHEAIGLNSLDDVQSRVIALPAWLGSVMLTRWGQRGLQNGLQKIAPEKQVAWRHQKREYQKLMRQLALKEGNLLKAQEKLQEMEESAKNGKTSSNEKPANQNDSQSKSTGKEAKSTTGSTPQEPTTSNRNNAPSNTAQSAAEKRKATQAAKKAAEEALENQKNLVTSLTTEVEELRTKTGEMLASKRKGFLYRLGRSVRALGSGALWLGGAFVYVVVTSELIVIEFALEDDIYAVKRMYEEDLQKMIGR